MVAQGFTMKTKTVFRQSFNTFLSEFLVEGIDLTTGSAKGDPHIAVRLDPDLKIFPML